jgi:hypothetical protein
VKTPTRCRLEKPDEITLDGPVRSVKNLWYMVLAELRCGSVTKLSLADIHSAKQLVGRRMRQLPLLGDVMAIPTPGN